MTKIKPHFWSRWLYQRPELAQENIDNKTLYHRSCITGAVRADSNSLYLDSTKTYTNTKTRIGFFKYNKRRANRLQSRIPTVRNKLSWISVRSLSLRCGTSGWRRIPFSFSGSNLDRTVWFYKFSRTPFCSTSSCSIKREFPAKTDTWHFSVPSTNTLLFDRVCTPRWEFGVLPNYCSRFENGCQQFVKRICRGTSGCKNTNFHDNYWKWTLC